MTQPDVRVCCELVLNCCRITVPRQRREKKSRSLVWGNVVTSLKEPLSFKITRASNLLYDANRHRPYIRF